MPMLARWLQHASLLVLATVGLVAQLTTARAQTIVVEGHVGSRPDDFARLAAPVAAALEQVPEWISAIQVGHKFESRGSRATVQGGEVAALQVRLQQLVASGNDAWMDADFGRARKIYRRAIDIARDAPVEVANGTEWKPLVQRALVGLALSAKRGGDAAIAEAAMQGFVRAYPGEVVDRTTFGPEAAQLFEAVKAVATKQARGGLVVEVDDPEAVVFVDDRWAGVGGARLDELLPGVYRVQTRKGNYTGRVYSVEVISKQVASLTVEWGFDAALVTAEWVGFVFPSQKKKTSNLSVYALQLAKAVGAKTVVVLEETEAEGRRLMVGSVLAVDTGRPVRTASMAVSPVEPSVERLSTLGKYLAGQEGITLEDPRAERPKGTWPRWHWAAVGLGVGAIAGGALLLHLDGQCEGGGSLRQCRQVYDTAAVGAVVVGGGVLLTAGSSYFVWTQRSKKAPMVAITGRGVTVGLAGSF